MLTPVKLNPDQVVALDNILHDKSVLQCPNHPSLTSLEATEDGISCTRCDHKVSAENIPHTLMDLVNGCIKV